MPDRRGDVTGAHWRVQMAFEIATKTLELLSINKSLMVSEHKMDATYNCVHYAESGKSNVKLSIKKQTKKCNINEALKLNFK